MGEPLVIPTTWALLALRHYPERRENIESLHGWRRISQRSSPRFIRDGEPMFAAYGRNGITNRSSAATSMPATNRWQHTSRGLMILAPATREIAGTRKHS